ncbi:MAG: hypothetical protein J5781_04385 [Clostridia bacterium]|nr:hypothetical protein [Clostridia bacterium]
MEEKAKRLLAAVKKDDLAAFKKEFDKDTEKYSFGRFPLLSLCYLYGSFKIAFTYEKKLLALSRYVVVEEDRESYYLFRRRAHRVLRLFVGGGRTVSPLVMLAVLGRHDGLRALYPVAYKDATIREEISYAAQTLYGSTVTFGRNSIRIRRQHTTRLQKITTYAACAVSIVMIACALLGYFMMPNDRGTEDNPVAVANGKQLVLALKNEGYYTLTDDVALTVEQRTTFKGALNGNGHKVSLSASSAGAVFAKTEGTIKDVEFVIDAGDVETSESLALLIAENTGTLENVTLTVKGNISVKEKETAGEEQEKETVYISAFVGKNSGAVSGCKITCDLTANNPSGTNAYLSVLASENTGTVSQCEANGKVSSTTTDLAGMVAENEQGGVISGCKVDASLSQESTKTGWSPNVAGLCLHNYGTISESKFSGAISVKCSVAKGEGTSDNGETVYAGGIGCFNEGDVISCESSGTIEGVVENALQCVGGIVGYNYIAVENNQYDLEKLGSVMNCVSSAKIDLTSSGAYAVYAGGMVGLNDSGAISGGTTAAKITCDATCHYLGGTVGGNTTKSTYYSSLYNQVYSQKQKQLSISGVESEASIDTAGEGEADRCVGGVVGLSTINLNECSFAGTIKAASGSLIGGIAGVCQSQIDKCSAESTLRAGDDCYVGGIVGINRNQVKDCAANVMVNCGNGCTVGGVAAVSSATIGNCTIEFGLVAGDNTVAGGGVGNSSYYFYDCTINCDLTVGNDSTLGGAIANNIFASLMNQSYTVSGCSVSGRLNAQERCVVGGMVGMNGISVSVVNGEEKESYYTNTTVDRCRIETEIEAGSNSIVGGAFGRNAGAVYESYCAGSIQATDSVAGGLMGRNEKGAAKYDFVSVKITANGTVGCLIGQVDKDSVESTLTYKERFLQENGEALKTVEDVDSVVERYYRINSYYYKNSYVRQTGIDAYGVIDGYEKTTSPEAYQTEAYAYDSEAEMKASDEYKEIFGSETD